MKENSYDGDSVFSNDSNEDIPMSEVSISLAENGINTVFLRATVNNDLHICWNLTDGQLMMLAAQAINIIRRRSEHIILSCKDMEDKIIAALEA